jgi:thiamine biosynthesis protein ThiI
MEFRRNEILITVRFGELWLKGRNRNDYIRLLEKNLRGQLSGERFTLERNFDRLLIRLEKESDIDSIKGKLRKTFGISRFEVDTVTKPSLASITNVAKSILAKEPRPRSVRIDAHRAYKQLPFDSMDITSSILKVANSLKIEPAVRGYEKELYISVTKDAAFLSLGKEKGAGGLPVGSSGKGIILLSGGIDSPVAAWYAMKRGVEPVYVHLHAFQDAEEATKGKVSRIIASLSGFHPHYKAYFVPSHFFEASSFKSGRYELILLKAFMLRLAEKVAEKEGANLIFTGESLGQVASQTPENIGAEQYGIKLPVLRPLIGYDKEEIIRVAKEIGTYEESIKPYRDVCSINAKSPKLNAQREKIRELMRTIGMSGIVTRSLKDAKVLDA